MSGKHSNYRVRSNTIECICVASYHTFQCMVFHDVFFELLLILRLAGHGRLRNNDRCSCPGVQQESSRCSTKDNSYCDGSAFVPCE